MKSTRVIGLDVFRSSAILCVLACHGILGATKVYVFRQAAACLGIFGVEQFFVLSGYLIGSILIRDLAAGGVHFATIKNFWVRRWYRTLPNYYAYLLLNILIAAPWKHHIDWLAAYPFFLQNFAWDMKSFFIVSWSLSIEEWFYLLFPLIILLFYRAMNNERKAVLASFLFFLVLPFVARTTTTGTRIWGPGVQMVVVYRLDAIAIGVGLAYLKYNQKNLWNKLCSLKTFSAGVLSSIFCFFALVWCGYGDASGFVRPGILNAISCETVDLSFALMLPWFSVLRAMADPWKFIFTWVSILSYSLYLSNFTVIKPLGAIWDKMGWNRPGTFLSLSSWLLAIFFLSIASYFFIEKPFLRRRSKVTSG